MIISFKKNNGGGQYVLPTATDSRLGGVMIGDGINVDSAGTISVTGGTGGGGIEVVTELPASGTDGQMVMLVENLPEKIIEINRQNQYVTATTIGVTVKTQLYNYEWFGQRTYVYAMPDGSVDLYNDLSEETTNIPTGTTYVFHQTERDDNNITFVVSDSGFTATPYQNIAIENQIANIHQNAEEIETLYTWSNEPHLMADIDYTTTTGTTALVRWKYDELPDDCTLCVYYYDSSHYKHLVIEDGLVKTYDSNNGQTITASTGTTIAQYSFVKCGSRYPNLTHSYCYWTDDEIIFLINDGDKRESFNIDDFYKVGWHKELEHTINNKVTYNANTFSWYDGDMSLICVNPTFEMYSRALKINPTSNYSVTSYIYTRNNSDIGPIFAPNTTGTTGYVCVAGNGWAAPTWVSPETITNGVKFWKGTQDQYDAIVTKDPSTMYIIIPDNN